LIRGHKSNGQDSSVNARRKKRILVVDAYPMLRHGLFTYLNAQPDLIVCGEADSIPSALIKIAECKPHLLVIGLRLGAADCVEFVKALKVLRQSRARHARIQRSTRNTATIPPARKSDTR